MLPSPLLRSSASAFAAAVLVATAGLAVAATPASATTNEVTVERHYAGFGVTAGGQSTADQRLCVMSLARRLAAGTAIPDVGGACLSDAVSVPLQYDTVDFAITDTVASRVVGRYTMTDVDFNVVASGTFCSAVAGVALPPTTWHIDVAVLSEVGGAGTCPTTCLLRTLTSTAPTTGTVKARFFRSAPSA